MESNGSIAAFKKGHPKVLGWWYKRDLQWRNGVFNVFPKKGAQGFGGRCKPSETLEMSPELLPSKIGLPGWSMALGPPRVRIFLEGASKPKDAPLKGGLEKKNPSSQPESFEKSSEYFTRNMGVPNPNKNGKACDLILASLQTLLEVRRGLL